MSRHILSLFSAAIALFRPMPSPAVTASATVKPVSSVPAVPAPADPYLAARAIAQALVPVMEGKVLRAYLCPARVWTIGFGTTRYPGGNRVAPGDVITAARAVELMHNDIAEAAAAVRTIFRGRALDVGQLAGLILFAHNLGGPKLAGSSMAAHILAGEPAKAGPRFDLWCNATDTTGRLVPLRGLQIRRRTERLIFEGVEPHEAHRRAQADFPPR